CCCGCFGRSGFHDCGHYQSHQEITNHEKNHVAHNPTAGEAVPVPERNVCRNCRDQANDKSEPQPGCKPPHTELRQQECDQQSLNDVGQALRHQHPGRECCANRTVNQDSLRPGGCFFIHLLHLSHPLGMGCICWKSSSREKIHPGL